MHARTWVTSTEVAPALRPRCQSGIALLMVLWMMALLSVIAANLVYTTRAELQIAGNLVSLGKAEALADAGIARAVFELSRPRTADPSQWRGDGRTHRWTYGEGDLSVTIVDESGKIDINTAPAPLLAGLFRSAGAADPEALADAVIDWRDADDLLGLKGAEKNEYLAAGKGHLPANASFETIDELRQVLGMTDEIFRQVERGISVHSYQSGVNSTIAPREVLLALPDATVEQVDQYIAQRHALQDQGQLPLPFPAAQGFPAAPTGSTYSVQVDVVLRDNVRFSREAVVRLSAVGGQPVTVLAWRSPANNSRTLSTAIGAPESNDASR